MLKDSADIHKYIQENKNSMVKQLEEWSKISSGSTNLVGLASMKKALENTFLPIADEVITYSPPDFKTFDKNGEKITQKVGDVLWARKNSDLPFRILLVGHMDTVFSEHHAFKNLEYINPNKLNGPGVSDMKGGLVVMLHALSALNQTIYKNQIGWDVWITADEELGSPASSPKLEAIASNYDLALIYEPAMDEIGTIAKNRKGSIKMILIAYGKAAHAGRNFAEGRNAIVYLSEVILAIHELNNKQNNITINIGIIKGGDALNIVPSHAMVELDIRIKYIEDELWILKALEKLIKKFKRKDYELKLQKTFSRPVKRVTEPTKKLFERIQKIGMEIGVNLDWQDSGGCCDGNNLANCGVPVIDTLGVRGGEIHSSREYVLLDSLVERATLSALLLCHLCEHREI